LNYSKLALGQFNLFSTKKQEREKVKRYLIKIAHPKENTRVPRNKVDESRKKSSGMVPVCI
jgi:hypothetical protein